MTQVSFQWKRLYGKGSVPRSGSNSQPLPISTLIALMVFIRRQIIRVTTRKRSGKLSAWFLGCLGVSIMFAWNWKLVLATVAGIGLMLLVYRLQNWNWSLQWLKWQQFFTGSQGKLTIAVGSGGLSAIGTYLAASIWAESENRWLAVGSILQGLGTLLTLLLLSWHILTCKERRNEAIFEQWLSDLAASEPLKRLIAVQQLTSLVNRHRLSSIRQRQLKDYFRLMFVDEKDSNVRSALLESLQQWEQPPLDTGLQPLQIPLGIKPYHQEIRG